MQEIRMEGSTFTCSKIHYGRRSWWCRHPCALWKGGQITGYGNSPENAYRDLLKQLQSLKAKGKS